MGAFNQAGFSLYSDNLIGFADDALVLVPIALAVIVGGVGFPVWLELRRRFRSPARWSLHTKLTLVTTGALLVLGFVTLTGLEWDNDDTLGGQSVAGKLLGGFFAAVTARSAGFNTVDYADMGTDSLFVTDLLMFVGGGERLARRRDQGDHLRGPPADRVGRAAQRARGGGLRPGHPGRDPPPGPHDRA